MPLSTMLCTFLTWNFVFSESRVSRNYTPAWAIQLQRSANDEDARFIANSLGLKYKKILANNYYLLTDGNKSQELSNEPNDEVSAALELFPKVIWFEQQTAESLDTRTTFSDPLWDDQYYLKSNTGYKVNSHVEDAWKEGFSGKGVTVVVVDDAVRGTHVDLQENYLADISTVMHESSSPIVGHGSQCAGVIAAEANNRKCGVGVAYDCNIAGVHLFAGEKTATDADRAQALYRDNVNPTRADIFSNSWGPSDDGFSIEGPGRLTREALKNGVERGRNRLGSIYVYSCGNGLQSGDSCAFDGYVNSIYTIAVASIGRDGKWTSFSEPCSAIMTSVYSTDMVTISGKDDSSCVRNFGQTSAAAALVSGILALALQANPGLTWRDMQYLIARSSSWADVDPDIERIVNAKKFTVNEHFGFGVLDALALVNNARNWNTSVPKQLMCVMNITRELGTQHIPGTIPVHITKDNLNCGSKIIKSLEHVQLKLDLDYTNRAVLVVSVKSHTNTVSKFVYPRGYDSLDKRRSYKNLVVTSVHYWGETVLGRWSVEFKEGSGVFDIGGTGTLLNMSLIFYGTGEVSEDSDNDSITPTHDSPSDDPEISTKAVIVGIVVAACCVIALCVAGVIYVLKCRPKSATEDDHQYKQELSAKESDSTGVMV